MNYKVLRFFILPDAESVRLLAWTFVNFLRSVVKLFDWLNFRAYQLRCGPVMRLNVEPVLFDPLLGDELLRSQLNRAQIVGLLERNQVGSSLLPVIYALRRRR